MVLLGPSNIPIWNQVKHILITILILLLSFPLFGQSSKPLGIVLPPILMGNLSNIQIQFLLKTLDEELSKSFDISTPPQNKSGECLVGCDVFRLRIFEKDGEILLSLRRMGESYSKIETKICERCKTIELNEKLKKMIEKLARGKKGKTILAEKKGQKKVLFLRLVKGEFRWYEDGNEDKDAKYEGEIENGLAHGRGTFTWPDGNKYEGEWKNGDQNGQGTLTLTSGNKYEGWFKDWRYHNRGVFTWSNGDKYEGEFKKGEKHGQGIYIQPEGRKYVGEYKNGLKNGLGTLTYGKGKWEGDKYVGEFKGGKKNGQGILTYSNGDQYLGEFKDGLKNGLGTLTYGKGELEVEKYEGEWKSGKFHGQGTQIFHDGRKYVGEFKDGYKN